MTAPHEQSERISVLVVEDNLLIAEDICHDLKKYGYDTVGPAGRVETALALIEREHIDGAMLDLNLNGEFSFKIAERLAAAHIPFVFLTGYDERKIVPRNLAGTLVIYKPFD